MGVRVRLRLVGRKAEVVTSALVNSGFESDDPEVILPPPVAELLGLEPVGVSSIPRLAEAGLPALGSGR